MALHGVSGTAHGAQIFDPTDEHIIDHVGLDDAVVTARTHQLVITIVLVAVVPDGRFLVGSRPSEVVAIEIVPGCLQPPQH